MVESWVQYDPLVVPWVMNVVVPDMGDVLEWVRRVVGTVVGDDVGVEGLPSDPGLFRPLNRFRCVDHYHRPRHLGPSTPSCVPKG